MTVVRPPSGRVSVRHLSTGSHVPCSAIGEKRVYGTEPADPTPQEKLDWLFGNNCPEEIKSYDRDGIMFIGDRERSPGYGYRTGARPV